MGDVWLIAGCLFGFGVLYTAVLIILAKKQRLLRGRI